MKMEEAVTTLVKLTSKPEEVATVVATVMKFMPDKDVPDATLRKVVTIGKALKKAGVKV